MLILLFFIVILILCAGCTSSISTNEKSYSKEPIIGEWTGSTTFADKQILQDIRFGSDNYAEIVYYYDYSSVFVDIYPWKKIQENIYKIEYGFKDDPQFRYDPSLDTITNINENERFTRGLSNPVVFQNTISKGMKASRTIIYL
jgi:hypothetical protein